MNTASQYEPSSAVVDIAADRGIATLRTPAVGFPHRFDSVEDGHYFLAYYGPDVGRYAEVGAVPFVKEGDSHASTFENINGVIRYARYSFEPDRPVARLNAFKFGYELDPTL